MKFIEEITLRQHTPLIHFQHYQIGATLRASELKPKLDQFLIQKLKLTMKGSKVDRETEVPQKQYLSWFNNKEKLSLGYKVKINFEGKGNYKDIEQPKTYNGTIKQKTNDDGTYSTETYSYPLFFGNMGRDYYHAETIKKFVFVSNKITLNFSSFNSKLLDVIKNNFPEFIALENFGSRQDKGFGSFYLDNTSSSYITINENYFDYKFEINSVETDIWLKFKNLFEKIELFYRALRAGINLKDRDKKDKFYFKSLLFLYFKDQKIQWEKKTIKEKFFLKDFTRKDGSILYRGLDTQKTTRPTSDALSFSSENKKLVKDLLGLSNNESWWYYKNSITKTEAKYEGYCNKIKKDKKEEQIERFKSPIFFKIIQIGETNKYAVYIKFNEEIPIGGKWFVIENKTGQNPFSLQIPNDFTLHNFFEFIKDKTKFEISTHVEKRFQNDIHGNSTYEYEILKNIFDSLTKIEESALVQ